MANLLYQFTLFLLLLGLLGYVGGSAFVICGVLWSFLSDYVTWVCGRARPRGPRDWQHLKIGNIPATNAAKAAQVKLKLTSSCEVHGKCVPRAGWYGTISHPLSMDE